MGNVRRLIGLAAAIVAAAALIGAAPQAEPTIVRSEAGRFILRIVGIDRPERINHMHGFDLMLATPAGEPVTGASIGLTGERRSTANPLPTMPLIAPAAGAGRYRAEGLRFHMPGEWRLVFDIRFAHIRDRATLAVEVK